MQVAAGGFGVTVGNTQLQAPRVLWVGPGEALSFGRSVLAERFCIPSPIATGGLKEAITQTQPDAVVLELGETADPVSLLADALGTPLSQEIPFLVLAPRPDESLAVRAFELGAAEFYAYPHGVRELSARLQRVIQQSRRSRQLAHQASTDALTGLSNYRALQRRLDEEFKRARRYEYPISAVMIDLDHLKQINDQFGHEVGNRALVVLSEKLKETLRETDFAARYGGDEFAVVLPHQGPNEARILFERLRRQLRREQLVGSDGKPLGVSLTLSAGIAAHWQGDPHDGFEGLLQAADAALYRAKRAGRDRVVIHDWDQEGTPAHS